MKAWTFLMLLVLVAMMAGTAVADVTATGDLYYYLGPPLNASAGAYDPTSDDPNSTTWNSSFTQGTPPAGTIPVGQVLVLAQRNLEVRAQWKQVTVNVQYTSASANVTYDRIGHGARDYATKHLSISESDAAGTPRNYMLNFKIIPQPDWEWVELKPKTAAPVLFTRATISSFCLPFPSTTTAGLIVLVLLLGGTAAWIIRHRHSHATA